MLDNILELLKLDEYKNGTERIEIAKNIADIYLNVGKRAHRKKEDECLIAIFENLKILTNSCTKKIWRGEADIYNSILDELYDFSQEEA